MILFELCDRLPQQAIGVPLRVVEHRQTQAIEFADARRSRQALGLDHAARIEDELI
jgi:hypothetical protein